MSNDSDIVENLLSEVQPRPEPSSEVRTRVLSHVEAAWQRRKARRNRRLMAIAASVMLGVAVLLLRPGTEPVTPIELQLPQASAIWVNGERVEAVDGMITVASTDLLSSIETTRLVTRDGVEVRLRGNDTKIRWENALAFTLDQGDVYISSDGHPIKVTTPLATVTDIGTQFIVSYAPGALGVAVREGIVQIDSDHGQTLAKTQDHEGDVVQVSKDRVTIRRLAKFDRRWTWIYDAHGGYQQANVAELLDAIARDLKLQLHYEDDAARRAATASTVSGSLKDRSPDAALEIALGISGLTARRTESGELHIRLLETRAGL